MTGNIPEIDNPEEIESPPDPHIRHYVGFLGLPYEVEDPDVDEFLDSFAVGPESPQADFEQVGFRDRDHFVDHIINLVDTENEILKALEN